MKYISIILLVIVIGCQSSNDTLPQYEKVVTGETIDIHSEDNFFNGTRFYTVIDFKGIGVKHMSSRNPPTSKGYTVECIFTSENSYNLFVKYNRLDIGTFNRNCKTISKHNE